MSGSYYPILYLDDVMAILPGREIWGYSKVDAEIVFDWSDDGNSVTATVSRSGTTLITIAADLDAKDSRAPAKVETGVYNLKLIPSVEEDGAPDVCHRTYGQSTTTLYDVHTGTGTLIFGQLSTDPLSEIPIYLVQNATFYLADFELGCGEVVYDYLFRPGENIDLPESSLK